MNGRIHIYTGNGKGKTSAALGLALRAAGNGMKTFIGQFMKGSEYGELKILENIKEIEVEQFGWEKCIRKEDVQPFHKEKTREGLQKCFEKAAGKEFDIIILDEILVSLWFGLVEEMDVIDFIDKHPRDKELVLTGRYATEKIMDTADLVTEMRCIKHYYDKGIVSRKGIEYEASHLSFMKRKKSRKKKVGGKNTIPKKIRRRCRIEIFFSFYYN
jgi:cob(I)alamin adenosyltransferase